MPRSDGNSLDDFVVNWVAENRRENERLDGIVDQLVSAVYAGHPDEFGKIVRGAVESTRVSLTASGENTREA